jgi:hypothetical protein
MKKLKNVRLYSLFLFLFLITISSTAHAGIGESILQSTDHSVALLVCSLLFLGFQMAGRSDTDDVSQWPYRYKGFMERLLEVKNEVEKWNPSSGPLYIPSKNPNGLFWTEIVFNINNKKDELIKNEYDDYPEGEAADQITKTTFATIDQLEKLITKKGGPTKLFAPTDSADYYTEKIVQITKQIEDWDGEQPFTAEQSVFVKAATDKKDLEKWLEGDGRGDSIGSIHLYMVTSAFEKLAKVLEKKGGKDALNAGAEIDPTLKFVLDEIIESTKDVNEFDPETRRWSANNTWIWRAISSKDRESWARSFFKEFPDQKGRFYKQLDKLNEAFAKKVHLLVPGDELFKYHNEEEEELMKEQVTVDDIHEIGIEQKNWEIQYHPNKEPKHKIKNGFIWGRNKKDDTPYCRLYQVTLLQQYAGGGQYEATYAEYFNSWPRPCPTGRSGKAKSSKEEKPKADIKEKTKSKKK